MGFFILLLITLAFDLVSADKVLVWSKDFSNQFSFPHHQKEEATAQIEIKNPSGENTYKIVCKTYAEESPKVDIKKDDIIVDTLFLKDVANACEETRLKAYIVANDPDPKKPKKETLTFLWSSKSPKCVKRSYEVNKFRYEATTVSEDVKRDKCEEPTLEYIKSTKSDIGGVVSALPSGDRDSYDFNAFVVKRGEPKKTPFPTKDPADKNFYSVCREDTVKEKDDERKVITTTIEHDEIEDSVIEKLVMENCDVSRININRQTMSGATQIKMVYETVPNVCFDRYINFNKVQNFYYYNFIGLRRSDPWKVLCPNSFVGDIDLNENIPWYKRWFAGKPKPFAMEIPARVPPTTSGSGTGGKGSILRDTTRPMSSSSGYTSLAASGGASGGSKRESEPDSGDASKRESEPGSGDASKATSGDASKVASGGASKRESEPDSSGASKSGKEPASPDANAKPASADASGKPASNDASKPTGDSQ